MAIVDQINRLTGGKNGNGSIEDALRILELNSSGGSQGGSDDSGSDCVKEIVPEITVTFDPLGTKTIVCEMSISDIITGFDNGTVKRIKVAVIEVDGTTTIITTSMLEIVSREVEIDDVAYTFRNFCIDLGKEIGSILGMRYVRGTSVLEHDDYDQWVVQTEDGGDPAPEINNGGDPDPENDDGGQK